jgi:hypothetical protein
LLHDEQVELDRVEVTGLRPLPLPHHRTCGLPHPAVGPSGLGRKIRWHVETPALESSVVQGSTTLAIISSFLTFWLPPAPAPGLGLRSLASCQTPLALRSTTARMVAAVATFAAFRIPARPRAELVRMAGFVVLRPFAPRSFPRFLATTASADSSAALPAEVSPGKVPKLSARSARLYLVRLSVTVGFRVP